jgi:large subunit ribosomal protein L30
MTKKLRVIQLRSEIGRPEDHRRTLKGLGLSGPHSSVLVDNTASFRGMIKKVIHLVKVQEHHED